MAATASGRRATRRDDCKLKIDHCKLKRIVPSRQFSICNDQFAILNPVVKRSMNRPATRGKSRMNSTCLFATRRRSALGLIVRLMCLACLAAASGCAAYQVGNWSLFPQHIRTVHVPVFESTSFRPHLGERLTEAVVKEIEAKTPYKVVGDPNADSVLSGRIIAETKRVLIEDAFDNPREVEVNMQVEVSWVDRRGDSLRQFQAIPCPTELTLVGGSASFIPEVGQSVTVAQQQAIGRMADQIVGMMETPW